MPSPDVPDPAAGTSHALPSAASIPPSRRNLSLSFWIHPSVVGNVFAHYTRVMNQDAGRGDKSSSGATVAQSRRVFGCLIGVQNIQKVDIFDSFELVVDPVSGTFDSAFFEKQQEHYKKKFPCWNVRGWYSTGSHVQDTDMKIHRKLLEVHHSPVYLLFNPAMGLSKMDSPTIYESDRRVIDGTPVLIFVRPKHTIVVLKATLSTEVHVEETTRDVIATMPPELGENADLKRSSFRRMLLETPSGFGIFGIDDKVFTRPQDIWAYFTDICNARDVLFKIGFLRIQDKSIAWDIVAGPGEDLQDFILQFCNKKGLIVQDLQLKKVIEKKLDVKCWYDEQICSELTWGVNFVLHEFLPQKKKNLTSIHLPLSNELDKVIKIYGLNITKQPIRREFISMVGRLKYFEDTSNAIFEFLYERFPHCLCGSGMSKIQYVEAVKDHLSLKPTVAIQDERYSTEDMLRAVDTFLAAPKQIEGIWSCLRRMEMQAQLSRKSR